MAKTTAKIKPIRPSDCVAALNEYNNRIFMLMNIMPSVREYVAENPSNNKQHQEYLLSLIDEHTAAINEFRNADL